STVMHRRTGRKSRKEEEEVRQKLTPEKEHQVLDRCYFRCRLGFHPTIWQWKEVALAIVQKRKPHKTLGKLWERKFKKRHPEAKSRFSSQLDFVCNTKGNNVELITRFFEEYISIIQDFKIKPQNTYNIDEIGFRIICNIDGSQEFITVIERVCGDGSTLDPTIILKAEEFVAEWFHKLPHIPENILFGRSHNGWTGKHMAKKFLERNFGNGSITDQKAKETNDYRLLIFDCHSSHVNLTFLEYCINHKIIPFCLPPHTMHRLQPLDVAIFSPYKHFYQKGLTKRFENHDYGIGKDNFYEVLVAARRQAFTTKNIISGFWNTGLIPTDGTIVLRKL
ncbi:DDE-domain-containing protein, partial [Tuber magnatum]